MKLFIVFALFLCAFQLASARWGHHQHHKSPHDSNPVCQFQTDKGSYDLRLLTRDMHDRDWELRDESAKSTFFFNPCGGVHNSKCPQGSALCQITEKDDAISFGSAGNLTWAEAQDSGVELTYANGEVCGNDVPRKTMVQLSCSKPTSDKATHRTVISDLTFDGCMITLKVSSPYGCPVEELCTVYDQKECEASEGLCSWNGANCTHESTSCVALGRHHVSLLSFIAIVSATSIVTLFACTVCLCACCRRRRRCRQQKKGVLPTSNKKAKKVEEMQPVPEPVFIYQPLQQYPGQQQYINAFPMVQFAPSIQNE